MHQPSSREHRFAHGCHVLRQRIPSVWGQELGGNKTLLPADACLCCQQVHQWLRCTSLGDVVPHGHPEVAQPVQAWQTGRKLGCRHGPQPYPNARSHAWAWLNFTGHLDGYTKPSSPGGPQKSATMPGPFRAGQMGCHLATARQARMQDFPTSRPRPACKQPVLPRQRAPCGGGMAPDADDVGHICRCRRCGRCAAAWLCSNACGRGHPRWTADPGPLRFPYVSAAIRQ